jgi:hypothetical protein
VWQCINKLTQIVSRIRHIACSLLMQAIMSNSNQNKGPGLPILNFCPFPDSVSQGFGLEDMVAIVMRHQKGKSIEF